MKLPMHGQFFCIGGTCYRRLKTTLSGDTNYKVASSPMRASLDMKYFWMGGFLQLQSQGPRV